MKHDPINSPSHYAGDGVIECIDAIRSALGDEPFVAFCRGTAIKYAWRAGKKSRFAAEDLRKGAWYLTRAADRIIWLSVPPCQRGGLLGNAALLVEVIGRIDGIMPRLDAPAPMCLDGTHV